MHPSGQPVGSANIPSIEEQGYKQATARQATDYNLHRTIPCAFGEGLGECLYACNLAVTWKGYTTVRHLN